ncbi:MAG: hypothetical protein ACO1QB_13895, partial [Verrucomicrobiales bacterium]
ARWKFLAATPPSNWHQASFNDSAWSEGLAKFGAGSGPTGIVTPLPPRLPSYYFRKQFTLDVPPSSLKELLIAATCTDDYGGKTYPLELYLNGQKIPSPGIEVISGDGNVMKYFDLFPFTEFLKQGENIIAVALNNTWQPTWDNVAFDFSLRVISSASPLATPRIESVRRQSDSSVALTISGPPGTNWDLQSSDNGLGNWKSTHLIALNASGTASVVDSGHDEAIHPGSMPVRFYRLIQR